MTKRTTRLTHSGRVLWIIRGKKIDLYVIEDAKPDKKLADPAIRLTKADGTQYTVAKTKNGPTCCCADFNYRHDKTGKVCKHILAMRAVKLL